jgi:hypothetical protein
VGIDVILQSETGKALHSVSDPLDLLPKLLRKVDSSNTTCLRFIDPYGDAVFNRAQALVLVDELEGLLINADSATAEFLDQVIALARQVASDVHLYLKFQGD